MADLIRLAEEFVATARQLDQIRQQMRIALTANGGDSESETAPHPTQARPKPGKAGKARVSKAEMMAAAKALDETALDLIRAQPGVKTGEIRKALAMKSTTATERIKRLRQRGLIEPNGEGWRIAAS
jgi:hypothetical protein